jgi:hypothetical protein
MCATPRADVGCNTGMGSNWIVAMAEGTGIPPPHEGESAEGMTVKVSGQAPEIFFDDVCGMGTYNFVVRMNLVAVRAGLNGEAEHTLVARLNIPFPSFLKMTEAMNFMARRIVGEETDEQAPGETDAPSQG